VGKNNVMSLRSGDKIGLVHKSANDGCDFWLNTKKQHLLIFPFTTQMDSFMSSQILAINQIKQEKRWALSMPQFFIEPLEPQSTLFSATCTKSMI